MESHRAVRGQAQTVPSDVCPCAIELGQVQSYKGGWNMEQSLVPWRKRKWVSADPRSPGHRSVIA